jgi:magnesium transporter
VRIYVEKNDGSVARPSAIDEVDLADAKVVWIDLEGPTDDEMQKASALVGAHPVALEYCKRMDPLPKVQEFPSNLFVSWCFISKRQEAGELSTDTVCMFLGTNFLLSIHGRPLAALDDIWDRLMKDKSLYKDETATILYAILDNAVDEYFPYIEKITDDIDDYQDKLLSGDDTGDFETILALKHKNMQARRMVAAHRDVILKLQRRDMPFIPEELSVYILDVYDLLVRAATEVDSNADLITASMDIDLNMISNRLNVVMKKLTIVATIFLPLTFIVGVYGMNFKNMPELGWRYGYLLAWAVLFVIAVLTYFFARHFVERQPTVKRKQKSGGKLGTGD